MLISFSAIDLYTNKPCKGTLDVDVAREFDKSMDADSVRETLDIIICDELRVVDINEEDLYNAAELVYQEINRVS